MRFPTVSDFCGLDLITAGLMFGFFGIFTVVVSALIGGRPLLNWCILAFSSLWLYGVIKERSSFMFPTVVISFIMLILLYLFLFGLILVISIFLDPENLKEMKNFSQNPNRTPLLITTIIIDCLATYFWIVQYSVYKHIKETTEHRYSLPNPQA